MSTGLRTGQGYRRIDTHAEDERVPFDARLMLAVIAVTAAAWALVLV